MWRRTDRSDQSGDPGDIRRTDRRRRMLKPSWKIRNRDTSELCVKVKALNEDMADV